MTDTLRDLLISLASHMAYMQSQLEARHELDDPEDYYWYRESVLLRQKVTDALADEPAVPEGREPASVAMQPSDKELLEKGPSLEEVEELCEEHCFNVEGYESLECLQGLINDALARWGNLKGSLTSSPPADGEVAELTGQLIEAANGAAAMGWDQHAKSILRAAELLQRQALVPVSADERLPGLEDCDAEGRCWWLALHQSWPCLYLMKADIALAAAVATHWLPAHALPLPEMKADIALAAAVATHWLHAHALPRPEVSE